jgi:DNA mismatch repair protein MutS
MSLIKEYFELTKRYIDEYGCSTLLLMQVGAFFEVYGYKDNINNTIHGSNIMEFSRICDLNVVDKKVCIGDAEQVVMAGFKDHLLDKYIKKLQDNGFTVVVYVQDQQCANTTRSLLGIYSPGTYFSTDTEQITNNTACIWIDVTARVLNKLLLEKRGSKSNNNNNLYVSVGMSVIDIYTGQTNIMEYTEQYIRNPTTFDELERFISIYNPSEIILIYNVSKDEINDIVSYANIKSKSIHFVSLLEDITNKNNKIRALNCEKQKFQTELLSKFYKINDISTFMTSFNENVWATQSFCYLLDFIYQHNPNLVYKLNEPIIQHNSNKLILANHSLKQLNIIDDDNYKGKYSSVVKMLNECVTTMGKRKFSHIFLNPITNKDELQKEYDMTEYVLSKLDKFSNLRNMLSSLKDISKINRQILLTKITPKLLYQLFITLKLTKDIYNNIVNDEVFVSYLQDKLNISTENNFNMLLTNINEIIIYLENTLILEKCKDIDNIQKVEESFIQLNYSQELEEKVKILSETLDQVECCRNYFNSLISSYESDAKKKTVKKRVTKKNNLNENNYLEDNDDISETEYVKIYETEKSNYGLIATDRRCRVLQELLTNKKSSNILLIYNSRFNNIKCEFNLSTTEIEFTKQSSSNKYINSPQINKLCKDVSLVKVGLIDTIIKVYSKIIKDLEQYYLKIENICNFITYLDLIYTKAHIASKYNYCKPEIDDSDNPKSYIRVSSLRHCLIEKIQQNELYVSNDINIGDGIIDGILLYGTNAVGKTSFIRALGISVIMAQAGLYVPASKYVYNPYKYIFTRILGNDNLFKGLSTFAVEMSELRTILRLADKNSLVLGDELCSGTESISAISIFVSGIQALYKAQCSFIFATHLHEIVNYDELTSLHSVAIKHMTVIYDREKDMLVYDRKLKDGPGTNMYGLEVCKSLNLPEDFLENANNIRMKYNPESASILDKKGSHYNSNNIVSMCEKCHKQIAEETHHLIYQQDADNNGVIKKDDLVFHKNHKANLINLCESCHNDIHKSGKRQKKVKTTKGIILKDI